MSISVQRRSFASLSVKDLLEAREAYHTHLLHLENVFATAIGRYRFAQGEKPGPEGTHPPRPRGEHKVPRTLANSFVTADSWPCVLVFVKKWIDSKDFGSKYDEIVPPRLYLPDGRVIPTCVIYAEAGKARRRPLGDMRFPGTVVGGGYPALSDVQGEVHAGTYGCLVSDGRYVYALTDRHVCGDTGTELYTLVQGEREILGKSDARQIGKLPFQVAFPGLPGAQARSNIDAGLVRVDDVSRWTSQVYGVGEFDDLADINAETATVDLVGCNVVAYGAASERMEGEIQALFYRYRSVGGMDYVADFLIGAREGRSDDVKAAMRAKLSTVGNSGAVWFLEVKGEGEIPARSEARDACATYGKTEDASATPAPRLRPIALHWGSQTFFSGNEVETPFALATSLGTICRELGVEIVRDVNIGLPETWGKVGHYKIGQVACRLPTDKNVTTLFAENLDRISFEDDGIEDIKGALAKSKFTALADVPDIVWKGTEAKRGRESPNHFADMDQVSPKFKKNLLQVTDSKSMVDPAKWVAFYESVDVEKNHMGLLPFRVWQLYDVMVAAVAAKDVDSYVCAAGVLAHYCGDACQPLHVSQYHDGDPDSGSGEGVHSAYETKMLDRFAAELNEKVNALAKKPPALVSVKDGRDAAWEIVQLMKRSIEAIDPQELVSFYENNTGNGRIKALFDEYGDRTAKRMIDGANVLASIWQAAWINGGGKSIAESELVGRDKKVLRKLYVDSSFAPSVYITMMSVENGQLVLEEK